MHDGIISWCCLPAHWQTRSRSGRPWKKDWSSTPKQRSHPSAARGRFRRDLSKFLPHTSSAQALHSCTRCPSNDNGDTGNPIFILYSQLFWVCNSDETAVMMSLPLARFIFLWQFLVCVSGVGRTVWRVRVRQPLFLMSWCEHGSWRASIWNLTKSLAPCCPSACGTPAFFLCSCPCCVKEFLSKSLRTAASL